MARSQRPASMWARWPARHWTEGTQEPVEDMSRWSAFSRRIAGPMPASL
ncbi:hypothetical protein AB0A05_21885 [Streptomyces sp. NPDC046374]